MSQKLSESFIEQFQDKVQWEYISCYQKLSEKFIAKFENKVNWRKISWSQNLSESFVETFQHKVNWYCISKHQKLSESFIEKFQDVVHWKSISECQKLSQRLITKFIDNVSKDGVARFQKLSDNYRQKFKLPVPPNSWINASIEFKRKQVLRTNNYILDGDYIIAYKGIRSENYSKYNFQYRGEKLIKVKIHLNDLGCIVRAGNKLRCFKFTVLEEVVEESA